MMRNKVKVHKVATLEGHNDSIYALTGDRYGYIYSSGGDGYVVQWDLSKPKDGHLMVKMESSVYSLAKDEENQTLIVGHNHQGIHVVDTTSRKEIYNLSLTGCGALFDIQVFKNTIFILAQSGELFLVDKNTRKISKKKVASSSLRSLEIDENYLYIGASDGTVRILDHQFQEQNVLLGAQKSVFSVLKLGDGLLAASRDCHLRTYAKSGELLEKIPAHIYAINHAVSQPQGDLIATASMDKTIKIWDKHQMKLLKVIDHARHQGHTNSVNKLFWSRYDNLLVSCSDDRTVAVWDLKN